MGQRASHDRVEAATEVGRHPGQEVAQAGSQVRTRGSGDELGRHDRQLGQVGVLPAADDNLDVADVARLGGAVPGAFHQALLQLAQH